MAQLDLCVVDNINLVSSSDTNKYTKAEERLLTICSESEEQQIKKLVNGIELGDPRPSQLLQKMRASTSLPIRRK